MTSLSALDGPIDWVLQARKEKSVSMCQALLKTSPGRQLIEPKYPELMAPTVGFIGIWSTTVKQLKAVHEAGRNFVYADNGYFRPYRDGGYFRLTVNSMTATSIWPGCSPDRYRAVGPVVKPWRKTGKNVLVCFQSPEWTEFFAGGLNRLKSKLEAEIRKHTDRPIVWRGKPDKADRKKIMFGDPSVKPLASDLEDAWCAIGLSSAALCFAAIEGIPVFPQRLGASSPIGTSDLSRIENPVYADNREEWLHSLASQQWTLPEIASGKARADLRERLHLAQRQEVLG